VLAAFDWQPLDKPGASLVDVGGNHGKVSQSIAKHTKYLSFGVQDLLLVVEQGKSLLPVQFHGRIKFKAHDFKEPQLSENPADAYLISRCLHNWSDHHATRILRALVPGLKIGSYMLIYGALIDSEPVKNRSEKFNLQQDFIMANVFNEIYRTTEELEQLLKLADAHFKVINVYKSKKCNRGMIEVLFGS
jgi:hypothetical protein